VNGLEFWDRGELERVETGKRRIHKYGLGFLKRWEMRAREGDDRRETNPQMG
jgi:hypothetical protein